MSEVLSVTAIEHGTVIDHIPSGQALSITRLLHLAQHKKKVTLGLNLPSQTMGHKDLIKVEDREITEQEASQIAIFAPKATINIIQDFCVVKKFVVTLPSHIERLLPCPNPRCITNHDPMHTHFSVACFGDRVVLRCHYCDKSFSHDTP